MEGNSPTADEKTAVQEGVDRPVSDSGEGDMFSSEYSLVSDSRAFTEEVPGMINPGQGVQSELPTHTHITSQSTEQLHTEHYTESEQEQAKTELVPEDFDITSIPAGIDIEQDIKSSETGDFSLKTSGEPKDASLVSEGKDAKENGEESFEVISKGDVDEIVVEGSAETKTNDTDDSTQKGGKKTVPKQDSFKQPDEEGWMYVLGHEKLKKKVTKTGQGHFTRPVYSQLVTVRYCGKLQDGTVIDNSDKFQFTIGDGDVIQALDLCLPVMELEETTIIETDPKYAFGDKGREPDIPPGAHLTYEVELLNIEDQPDYQSLPIKERIEAGSKKRERGNWWYSRTDYNSAINSYNKALTILDEKCGKDDSPEDVENLIEERDKCHNNLGAAQLKVEAWQPAIRSCDAVLKHQPDNVKALFRKGKCLAGKGDIETAIAVLRESLKREPESKLIHQELSRLVNKHKIQSQTTKEMYQRMLGTDKAQCIQTDEDQQDSMWKWYIGGAALAALASASMAAYKYM